MHYTNAKYCTLIYCTYYTKYFDSTNSIKYELGNTESATKSIKEAVNRKKDTLQSVTYKEDWNPILENI